MEPSPLPCCPRQLWEGHPDLFRGAGLGRKLCSSPGAICATQCQVDRGWLGVLVTAGGSRNPRGAAKSSKEQGQRVLWLGPERQTW